MEKSFNPEESQKLRGGYYTPSSICTTLAEWAIQSSGDSVLEPSCGDGEFVYSAVERLVELGARKSTINKNVHGIEFNTDEAVKAQTRVQVDFSKKFNIINEDFFSMAETYLKEDKKFDVVLGNPPFIKYQSFHEEHRETAFKLMNELGLNPNRLTNAWAPFVVLASSLLKESGRMAMVIPSELYQVSYAGETRKFLLENFQSITLINFKSLLFEGAQQEVILFLGEKMSTKTQGIQFLEFDDADDFAGSDFAKNCDPSSYRQVLRNSEKWTKYYLDPKEISMLRNLSTHENVARTVDYFDVEVGIVTGQNKFFVRDKDTVEKYKIQDSMIPCMTRTNLLQGLNYSKKDWNQNYNDNKNASLFYKTNSDVDNGLVSSADKKYIKYGEESSFNTGYKCRIRKNWFCVPSMWIPGAFFLRQVYKYPKLVLNSAKACPTDTIHRVRFNSKISSKTLCLAFLNSMTFAQSEIMGRSYGGGVLTFEPSEAEKLLFPKLEEDFNCEINFNEIDLLLREGKIEDVLDITDKVFLEGVVGLSAKETRELRDMWIKLRDRRLNRKNTPAKSKKKILQ